VSTTRRPSNSGTFYPTSAVELRCTVEVLIADATPTRGGKPKAIIAPHAGYEFSGAVAATAYARVAQRRGEIERVVLVGPVHYIGTPGIATCTADAFETPLGDVLVDRESIDSLGSLSCVRCADAAHALEHSLEVHLPFVQVALGEVTITPLLVGDATLDEVALVLDALWGGDETLIVVSSDLSHELSYDDARSRDAATSRAIEQLAREGVDEGGACGHRPIGGLLEVARARGLSASTLDVRSSGDTAGRGPKVVGYGAYAFV
jgi:MEMO1 family protein